ncbi:MFS transporter [uncultured Herbaspirillum sp.]|uniref:MFS transporter n=1 Tax=uncultured Herbaspirillum sp. TaxID=160236 RepID=UPI0025826505|nr:MFS transporter [uncultured Herbaspirillum sp.]
MAGGRAALLLATIGGVYVAQSLVTGVAGQALPALLRSQGSSLQQLGWLSLLMLPWALKFAWAPWIERRRLPAGRAARSRRLVCSGQLMLAALFALMAAGGGHHLALILLAMSLAALLAASIDVACDGFAIEQSQPSLRGWVNVVQVAGSYAGLLLGGGLFLLVAQRWGMAQGWLLLAAVIVLLGLPWYFQPPAALAIVAPARPASLRQAWRRREVRAGLLLTVLLAIGPRLVMGLTGAFLLDHGMRLEQLAWLQGVGGVVAGISGALLGGLLVRYWQARAALVAALVLQALALLCLAGAPSLLIQAAAAWVFSLALSATFVASYTLLMRCAEGAQPGVDFTLFQCADAGMAVVLGILGGWLAHTAGYVTVLGLAALALVLVSVALCARCTVLDPFSEEKCDANT